MTPDDFDFMGETKLMGYGESDTSGAWIKLQVMPDDLEIFRGLKGEVFDTALRNVDKGQIKAVETPKKGEWGKEAQILRQSGFFRSPAVWRAVGTDKDYLEWLKTQECAAKHLGGCEGDIVAAHVRRISNGSGVGIKPKEFSAIPLCHRHHMLQHQKGESEFHE